MKKFSQGLWLSFAFLSMFVLGFADNIRGPLFFDILKEFHLTDLQGAWFYSASSTLGFFASLSSALLLKRMHLLQLLILACLIMSLALLGIGSFSSYSWFLIGACGLGASMGLMGVAQNSSISFLVSPEFQGKAYSALHAMYGLSSVLAPLVVGWGLSAGWHWRDFFTFSAAVVFLLFVTMALSPYPKWAIEHRSVAKPEKNTIRGLGRAAFILSLSFALYVIAEILVGSRISLYTIRELGMTVEQASHYVAGFYIGLLSGRVWGIFFKMPGSIQRQLTVSLILSLGTLFAGLYINPWWFSATGLAMSMFFPTFVVYLSVIYKSRIGMMMSLAIGLQSFFIVLMHQLVGFVSDIMGIRWAFHLGFLFIVLSLLLLWWGEIERKKQ